MSIKDKVVLITGSSGLLGRSFTKGVIENSGKVILVDIVEPNLSFLNAENRKNIKTIKFNITNTENYSNLINSCISEFGKIDAVIHSAYPKSKQWGTKFENLSADYLKEDLFNQLGCSILFSQKVIEFFIKQGYGNLIHISSIQGVVAPKFSHYENTSMVSPIEYSAIKAGIISITKYLAKYYAKKNIRVNCISPGGILDNQNEKFLKKYSQSCLSKGMLDPEDVTGSVLFLLSDDSRYINGQNIIVDDGWIL